MPGRIAVITGPTSGIGRATARALARLGYALVLVARDRARAEALAAELGENGGRAEVVIADLSLVSQVRSAAGEIAGRHPAIHLLVNNAGAVFTRRELTAEGHERTFALNVLAPFLITRLLLPNLRAAGAGARVVDVSSAAHHGARLDLANLESRPPYHGFSVYSRSKLALLLVGRAFAARSPGHDVVFVVVHPGFVRSRFGLANGGGFAIAMRFAMLFGISPTKAARTVIYAATSPDLDRASGAYVAHERIAKSSRAALDVSTGTGLWAELSRLTGLPESLPSASEP
ncbi:MAG: SDR family NAD(P)-dependent oxidoreductase [Thermoplasmata archaeon]|nr:SDR family NAD(P)-dependent oxidoreductase [Thermoplasmata archaeon]